MKQPMATADQDAKVSTDQQLATACAAAYGIVDSASGAVRRLVEISGHRVACRRGCHACCCSMAPATWVEAVPIAKWLAAPQQKLRLERFREQTDRLRQNLGPELATIEQVLRNTEVEDPEATNLEPYKSVALHYRGQRQFCPFKDGDGACEIYPLRPLVCRVHWVADTSDDCDYHSQVEPLYIEHPSLAEALQMARRILAGASVESGHPGQWLLPEAITQALTCGQA